MHKVSNVSTERFSQDPLEMYFCKQRPPGAWKDKSQLNDLTLVMPALLRTKNYSSQ